MYKQVYLHIDTFSGYVRFEQLRNQNFYESETIVLYGLDTRIYLLMSYNTIVGCVDLRRDILYHFGKGYSTTTSKQLTMYISNYRNYMFNKVIYLDNTYNFEKFKKEYLDRA